MTGLDYITPLNVIIGSLGTIAVLLMSFFANRYIDQVKKRDAKRDLAQAIADGVALARSDAPPHQLLESAMAFVVANEPKALKTLAVDRPLLEQKVKATMASRGTVF